MVFFFKQKTAYEMRISDWSSDVCSSDLNSDTAQRNAAIGTSIRRDQCMAPPVGGFMRYCVTSNQFCPAIQSRTSTNRKASSGSRKSKFAIISRAWKRRASAQISQISRMASGNRQQSEEHTSELQSLMRI